MTAKQIQQFSFEDKHEDVKKALDGATLAALKAVAKLLRPKLKAKYRTLNKTRKATGNLSRSVISWARRKDLSLQIGVMSNQKAKAKGQRPPFYVSFFEFGTSAASKSHIPELEILRETIEENIDEIRLTEGEYLKFIEDDNRARGLMDEDDEESDE